ncbi:hypothetical protein NDK43_25880 [Neobacillus pocheonensis]|uniref:Uncharacterized protein n=1 Tax=Neobacillus pocheonensis TaxID=363869 RepID=A0ABT0WGG3_9BACI|nr:hypothetical protein [Neobacillus pocheonensis]
MSSFIICAKCGSEEIKQTYYGYTREFYGDLHFELRYSCKECGETCCTSVCPELEEVPMAKYYNCNKCGIETESTMCESCYQILLEDTDKQIEPEPKEYENLEDLFGGPFKFEEEEKG